MLSRSFSSQRLGAWLPGKGEDSRQGLFDSYWAFLMTPECRCQRWGQRWAWGKHVDAFIRETERDKCLQKILARMKEQEGDKKTKLWEAAEESREGVAGLDPLLVFPLLLKAPSLQLFHSCGSSLTCCKGLQWNGVLEVGSAKATLCRPEVRLTEQERNRALPVSSHSPRLVWHQQSL